MRLGLALFISTLSLPCATFCQAVDAGGHLAQSTPHPFATSSTLAAYRTMSTPAGVAAAAADAPVVLPPLVPEEGDDDKFAGYGPIISSLFLGHPKWGFLIYRVHYDDDDAWQRFMAILKRVTESWLRRSHKARLLPYLFFTTMEDRDAFDGASKEAIREHFRNWVNTRSVERDGPGADMPNIADFSPRYRACLFVDRNAIESASLTEYPSPVTGVFLKVEGSVALIDGQFGEHNLHEPELNEYDWEEIEAGYWSLENLEEEEFEPIEGQTTFDVGWLYVQLQLVSTIYDRLCERHDEWINTGFYKRPPEVWDGKF